VAVAAGASRAAVSRIERGQLASLPLDRLRVLAGVLDIRLGVVAHWRGGEASRVVNERHSRMHELVAARLTGLPEWTFAPEVTYSLMGERGVIDVLAWHAPSRTLLVLELKTEITDPAGLVAQVDRYSRLAVRVARDRAWHPLRIGTWVLVAESDLNRRRLARHRTMLRNAFPLDGRFLRGWLRDPAAKSAGGGALRGGGGGGGGPHAGVPHAGSAPERGGPHAGSAHAGSAPERGGPHAGSAHAGGPHAGGPHAGVPHLSGLAFLAIARSWSTNQRLGPTRRVRRGREGAGRPAILVNASQATHKGEKEAAAGGPQPSPRRPAGRDQG
jgi:transcriptional regulator with XRE-family HTH domain